MQGLFSALDGIVEKFGLKEFDNVKLLKNVTDRVGYGVRPSHFLILIGFLLTMMIFLNVASFFLTSFVGFLYPAYMSFKAIESTMKEDD